MKAVRYLLISVSLLVLVYFVGPIMPKPVLSNNLPTIRGSVENYVSTLEEKPGLKIKPGCRARIVWANDSTKQATENVLLYLHGFSASWREGYPINEEFAKTFGCNAYFARLAAHGEISENPLLDMTPERLYESAKEALEVAHQLGRKVVIMGCSTGCTLGLKLAADFPNLVDGMILYSPNIRIKQKTAMLLSGHWGLQIAELNFGGKFRILDYNTSGDICKYWNCSYRAEATVYLQQLLDATMNKEQFAKVKCPVFVGYYYKDEENQDEVVEVKASVEMFNELGTPEAQKRIVDFPNAGNHVLCSPLFSKAVPEVRNATFRFAEEILGMKPNKLQ
jgi:esterase/lipase